MPLNLLHGKKVRLVALTKEDLATVAQWYQDAEFMRLFDAAIAFPKTESQLTQWLEEAEKSSTGFIFAIRSVRDNALLGYLEVDGILWNQQTSWLSIGIGDQEYWGRGYGYEALTLALQFAFSELNLHRVQLSVFSYNQRAINLYEKAGFQHEGTYREFLHRDGERYDMLLYGLLRPEWEEQQAM